jgi:uncharacterized membrane protein (UPF0127 family)
MSDAARPIRRRIALLCIAGLALAACRPAAEPSSPAVTIHGRRVEVELALTPETQARGLGYRDALAWDHGMLFVYDEPFFPRFWMRGMRFDIDIVWIRDGRIVDISHRVPHVPGENGPTVQPRQLASWVLEVPAGYAEAHRWRVGQRVEAEGVPGHGS